MPCNLNLLGGLSVSNGDRGVSSFVVKESGWVFAYLALSPERRFPQEELAELFWPHKFAPDNPKFGPEQGLESLRKALTHLRAHLSEDLGLNPDAIVKIEDGAVFVVPGSVESDAARFQWLADAGDEALTAELKVERLREAISLYKGELLPGLTEWYWMPKRRQLKNSFYRAFLDLCRMLGGIGAWQEAENLCFRVIAMRPLYESPNRALMEVLERQGKYQEALDHFREYERLPRTEEDLPPSQGLRLYVQALHARWRGEAGPPDVQPDSSPLPQNGQPPFRADGGALGEKPDRIEQLPMSRGPFIGREAEIGVLVAALETHRAVILVGFPGIGKTRLALELARRRVDAYDAVVFVNLANVFDADDIHQAIASAIDLPFPSGQCPLLRVTSALGSREALVVLDNFEQLAEEGPECVSLLLKALPKLTVVITTRRALDLLGALEIEIESLKTPDEADTYKTILESDCVQLFRARAGIASPEFEIAAENAAAVAEICRRLNGIPLAIEMVAARAGSLDLNSVQSEPIEDLFRSLATEDPRVDSRHRSMRGTFNWSYRLLPVPAMVALKRLSVFRGGWTQNAAKAICKFAPELLDLLQDCHLVVAEHGPNSTIRFAMPEILREYAEELLSGRDNAFLARNHAAYYLKFAEKARAGLRGADQGAWLRRLEADHFNIQHVLAESGATDPEAALRLACHLPLYWDLKGHWGFGHARLRELLGRTPEVDPRLRAHAALAISNLAQRLGKYADSEAALTGAIDHCRDHGFRDLEAIGLGNLGRIWKEQGRFDEAALCLDQCLGVCRELGERYVEALTLANLGSLCYQSGNYASAREHLEAAVEILKEFRLGNGLADAMNNLGGVMRELGGREEARLMLISALELRREIEDLNGQAYSFDEFARLAAAQGAHKLAARLLATANVLRTNHSFELTPVEKESHAAFVGTLKAELGPSDFDAEWRVGCRWPPDEAANAVLTGAV